eukprot:1158483-Pelagomonas_calceolata.AAC.1
MLMELNNVLANSLRNALSSKLSSGPAPLMAAVPLDGDDAGVRCMRHHKGFACIVTPDLRRLIGGLSLIESASLEDLPGERRLTSFIA